MVKASSEKRARKEMILKMVLDSAERGREADEEKLIYYYCNMWNTTRRTMLEYLKELEMIGEIKREFGAIVPTHAASTIKEEAEHEADKIFSEKPIEDGIKNN